MIVQMLLVQMGGDNDLKPISPHLPCQLHPQSVTLFRRDFSGLEALVAVPRNITVLLAVTLFGENHLLQGNVFLAVDGGNELAARCLVWILSVGKHVEEALQFRPHRLFRVFHIIYQIFQSSLDMP